MARHRVDYLNPAAIEQRIPADEKRVGPFAHKTCKSRIDLPAGTGVEDLELQAHSASSQFRAFQRGLDNGICRIDQHGHTSCSGHQLTQQFQPLCCHLDVEKIGSCQVAVRTSEAREQARS
jgi:hypothetical protein